MQDESHILEPLWSATHAVPQGAYSCLGGERVLLTSVSKDTQLLLGGTCVVQEPRLGLLQCSMRLKDSSSVVTTLPVSPSTSTLSVGSRPSSAVGFFTLGCSMALGGF